MWQQSDKIKVINMVVFKNNQQQLVLYSSRHMGDQYGLQMKIYIYFEKIRKNRL